MSMVVGKRERGLPATDGIDPNLAENPKHSRLL